MSAGDLFTTTSLFSLAGVTGIALTAYTGAKTLLPQSATSKDRFIFVWLVSVELVAAPHNPEMNVVFLSRPLTH